MIQEEKTYHITTFGCQMNERDSETLAGMLTELGYGRAAARAEADVAIINTCSVRENADKRFFGTLGQLKKKKRENPAFIVCVCGCMMQQQHIIDTVKSRYPWVDILFGTHNIHEFPRLLEAVRTQREKQAEIWPDGGEIVEGLPSKRACRHKAFVNIMFGCDNFCTYCIVPYTRGRERSRDPGEIEKEVRRLTADGVREITLLGQNVNSYKGIARGGNRDGTVTDFAALIRRLDAVPGLERIRFMTSHPKDLSDELIAAYGTCRCLCPHIHLPVQSGSSRILARMNRKYTRQDYMELLRKLRNVRPGIAVTTDIIVGFPGETEEDFEETLSLAREADFDSAFTFLYSVRKGTPAESYEDQVPEEIKHRRFRRLVETINEMALAKNRALEGKTVRVLVDSVSKSDPSALTGRTETFKTVNFIGDRGLIGQQTNVTITKGKTFHLDGEWTPEKAAEPELPGTVKPGASGKDC